VPLGVHSPEAAAKLPDEWEWLAEVSWFTDMAHPDRIGLGLTSAVQSCDRTAFRYRVTDPGLLLPWAVACHLLPRAAWRLTVGDHSPGRWWVAWEPVPVVLHQAVGPSATA
jgi:hypothetical protein